jgi:S1-C subfamily serine protease
VIHGWGIAHRLSILNPQGKILLMMPWREGEKPEAGAAHVFYKCPPPPKGRLGMAFDLENSPHQNRVAISDIRHGSPADSAGLRPGDIILRAGNREVVGLEDLHRAGKDAAAGDKIFRMEVERDGNAHTFNIRLPSREQ